MRTNPKAVLTVLLVLLLGACTDSTGLNGDVSGTYTLRTVGGQPLPYTEPNQDPSDYFTINGGAFTLNSNGNSTETLSYTETVPGQQTNTTSTCFGTYSQSGNTIFVSEPTAANPDCGGTFTASWNGGNNLTLNINTGVDAVFTR